MNHAPLASSLTRREAVKVLGAGAALAGLGVLAPAAAAQRAGRAAAPSTVQPFVLPKLGYAFDALEPHIDARTMELHYTKHHQAYIDNANRVLAEHPVLRDLSAEAILKNLDAIPESFRTALRDNVGGHVNHSFFWRIIDPNQPVVAKKKAKEFLRPAIKKRFGSEDAFQRLFTAAALDQFGSGWAWLSVANDALTVHTTSNQDSPLDFGATPVLGLDVWEHAYYLKRQSARSDYVEAFGRVLNWPQA